MIEQSSPSIKNSENLTSRNYFANKVTRTLELGPKEVIKKVRQKLRQKLHEINYQYSLRKKAVLLTHPIETRLRRKALAQYGSLDRASALATTLTCLEQDGFSPLNSAQVDQSLYAELNRFVEEKEKIREKYLRTSQNTSMARTQSKKDFFDRLYSEEDLREDHILVKYALQPNILETASRYLGQIPRLSYVEVILSHVTENAPTENTPKDANEWKISQRWHRDYDDSRMLKFFTYFTDCLDDDHGPFTYIPAGPSQNVSLPVFPVHKTDAMLEAVGMGPFEKRVFGTKGTSFLIDTHRCFHRGSRMKNQAIRIAYIASFTSHATHIHYPKRIKSNKPGSIGMKWILR